MRRAQSEKQLLACEWSDLASPKLAPDLTYVSQVVSSTKDLSALKIAVQGGRTKVRHVQLVYEDGKYDVISDFDNKTPQDGEYHLFDRRTCLKLRSIGIFYTAEELATLAVFGEPAFRAEW